jgi:hypothetical protein
VRSACWLAEHGTDELGVHKLGPVANVDQADALVDAAKTRCAVCPIGLEQLPQGVGVRAHDVPAGAPIPHPHNHDATRFLPRQRPAKRAALPGAVGPTPQVGVQRRFERTTGVMRGHL